MRTRASFKSHAFHQMLIPFPIAFLVGAFVFDVAGTMAGAAAWVTTGGYLAIVGVAMAVVAAVPGFIDYLYSVPPRSSAKRRATRHLLVNLSAVALFVIALLVRDGGAPGPGAGTLVLQGAGLILLGMGGWMGGTLVNRNQIGVDHRYASAGKWHEVRATFGGDGMLVVPGVDRLDRDQMILVHADGRRIAVGRTAEGFAAFDDHCPHRGGPLADGVLMCGTVQCPWHGSQFDVRTGEVRAGPAEHGIRAYAVERRGSELRIRLESPPPEPWPSHARQQAGRRT